MTFFLSDYSLGAHPKVLKALEETNLEHTDGYGHDRFCDECEELIRKMTNKPEAKVYFFVGGTPANVITLTSMIRPYEGIIAPRTGHIYVHETGGIEMHGNRVFPANTIDGKLTVEAIEEQVLLHEDEHTVIPKAIYISQPTENGSVYKLDEIKKLRECCDKYGFYLYIDGARLGTALTARTSDVTLKDLAKYADAFYIGGTKLGALMGEAMVLCNPKLDENFRYIIKRGGGHLAKGRLLGVQMLALLSGEENSTYFEIARKENQIADKLAKNLVDMGYKLWVPQETNQIFVILPNEKIEKLNEEFMFYTWTKYDENSSVIRLVINWNTKEEEVNELLKALNEK